MSASRPFSGSWTNSQAGPGNFPVVSKPSPMTFPITPLASRPGNADVILGFATPKRWMASVPFDTLQASKELIFCSPWHVGEHPDEPQLMSLGQVNLCLRTSWEKFENIRDKMNPNGDDAKIQALALQYNIRGEEMFYDADKNVSADNSWLNGTAFRHGEKRKFFMHLHHLSILENYRLAGVKKTATNFVSGISGDRSCAMVQNGHGIVVNYWGKDIQIGQNLFLVLKQSRDSSGHPGPFQFTAWSGLGAPHAHDLKYLDCANRPWRGAGYRVGQITRGNHITVSETRRKKALGIDLTTTAEEINKEAVAAPSLDINVAIGDDV
jgi:hypothetical protein